jgi:hypothetical protein
MKWTKEEVKYLERMWLAPGLTVSAIARNMGRTRDSVSRKAQYLDLPKRVVDANAARKHKDAVRKQKGAARKHKGAVREIIREGYDRGRTVEEIIRNLSDAGHQMTKNAVIGLAYRMGLKNKKRQKYLPYTQPPPEKTEAQVRSCKWVKRIDPGHPPSVEYCHRKAGEGGVWCDQHREIVYVTREEMPKWLRKLASER